MWTTEGTVDREVETISDDDAHVLFHEQMRRRSEELQRRELEVQVRQAREDQVMRRRLEERRGQEAQVISIDEYRESAVEQESSVTAWQEQYRQDQMQERQERDRMIRAEWPEGDKDSILEKIFNDRFEQMKSEEEQDKILKPLPDELFEID